MATKQVFICDLCGDSIEHGRLHRYNDVDVCDDCRFSVMKLVIANKGKIDITLRPYCLKCKGTGKMEVKEERGGYNEGYLTIKLECTYCKIG